MAPDLHVAVDPCDALQLGDTVEVDEVRETGEAERQQRHQALTAGEDLGLVAVVGEQADGLGDGLRRVVLERRWLHAILPP